MSEELKNAYYLLRATGWVRRSCFWQGLTRRNFELTHLAGGYDGYQAAMGSENFVAQTVQTGLPALFLSTFATHAFCLHTPLAVDLRYSAWQWVTSSSSHVPSAFGMRQRVNARAL